MTCWIDLSDKLTFDMIADVSEILRSAPAVYAGLLAAIATLLKAGKSLLHFHDEYVRKRPFKRLSFLAMESGGDEQLGQLIAAAKRELVFREIFDTHASPRFMTAVHHLLASGRFSLLELRASSLYLRLENDTVGVHLGVWAAILFWLPLVLVIAMAVYIGLLFVALIATQSLVGIAAAAVLFALFILFAWFLGRDAREVIVARALARKLEKLRSET